MAVCLTLALCIIRPAACLKKKVIWHTKRNSNMARNVIQWILYSRHCVASLSLTNRGRNAPRLHYKPPPRPRQRFQHLQTASLPIQGRFQLCHGTHYSIALWGCRRLQRSAAGEGEAVSADPGAQLLTCRVFQKSTGHWPLRGLCGQHII